MRSVFCTIITPGYIPYALALRESLLSFQNDVQLYVMLSEREPSLREMVEAEYENTSVLYAEDLCKEGVGKAIWDKYAQAHTDLFRWSMKPVLINHLLAHKADKVIYVDCDIHFYADYRFLFDELDNNNVLLTPHWRASDPLADEFNFMQLYVYGLYNAGFVAVNSKAVAALEWWANANLFICEINAAKGQYVDQTHLNLLPVYFDGVKSLNHRGCNVAGWNLVECKRTLRGNGVVYINDCWPVVFVHFSESTFFHINSGQDPLLKPYMDTYVSRVEAHAQALGLRVTVVPVHPHGQAGLYRRAVGKLKSVLKTFN